MPDEKNAFEKHRHSAGRLTIRGVTAALMESRGNILRAAELMGKTRQGLHDFIRKNPQLEAVRDQCREIRIDVAESSLDKAAESGEGWAVGFLLSTIGKKRGYTRQLDIAGGTDPDGNVLPVQIFLPDNGRDANEGTAKKDPATEAATLSGDSAESGPADPDTID